MSDLNDDLLNYDIGEDIDEQVLLAADEDDLLLSDEEDEQRAIIKNEAEDWVNSKLKRNEEEVEPSEDGTTAEKKPDEIVTTSTSCKSETVQSEPESPSHSVVAATVAEESDVSTSAAESPVKPSPEKSFTDVTATTLDYAHTTKHDEVSSTNKEIEEQTVSQTSAIEFSYDEPTEFTEGKLVETNLHAAHSETDLSSDPREDFDDERAERTNIKLSVERDDRAEMSPEKFQMGGRFQSRRGGGRGGGMLIRGGSIGHFPGSRPPVRYPHLNYPQYPHPNENLNPQLGTIPGQYPPPYNHMDAQMGPGRQPNPFAGCNPMQPRMEFRQVGPGGFRPQNPNDFNNYRGGGGGGGNMRPDFPNGAQYPPRGAFGPNTMRPMYRPDVPQMGPHMRQRMPLQRAPGGLPQSGPGPYIPQQSHGGMMPVPGGGGLQHPMTITGGGGGHPPMAGNAGPQRPRKVLINPNFKGGVEAATNQLMKDTQFIQAISSHAPHLQSDEELLRQQEEFINKNRIHIEKRRYERSPERNRSRERSYSPPRRSDRDRRGDSRERRAGSRGRNRRAGSREFESRNFPKRRRSDSFERRREKDKVEVEEDEETRAYRLKIEKQKEMREQILRDKEMRRRKAAVDKLIEEKPTTTAAVMTTAVPTATTEEAPTKLKPIIVTESKIISLRRKPKMGEEEIEESKQQTAAVAVVQKSKPIHRTIPTAKILPETIKKLPDYGAKESATTSGSATMAVIKPVVKKPAKLSLEINRKHAILDDDELLEEELLADTPSPPSSPKSLSPIDPLLEQLSQATSGGGGGGGGGGVSKFLSSHRRVILKSSKDQNRQTVADSSTMATSSSTSEQTKKGIFDRLEKRPRNKECRVTD